MNKQLTVQSLLEILTDSNDKKIIKKMVKRKDVKITGIKHVKRGCFKHDGNYVEKPILNFFKTKVFFRNGMWFKDNKGVVRVTHHILLDRITQ